MGADVHTCCGRSVTCLSPEAAAYGHAGLVHDPAGRPEVGLGHAGLGPHFRGRHAAGRPADGLFGQGEEELACMSVLNI